MAILPSGLFTDIKCSYYAFLKVLYNMFTTIQGQKTLEFSPNIQFLLTYKYNIQESPIYFSTCLKRLDKGLIFLNPSFPKAYFALIGQMFSPVLRLVYCLQRVLETKPLPFLNFSSGCFLST